ncbi:hypothetical protein JFU48_20970 [Pseudomonas sp. TH49]|uniref:hypothetical protein n=1 Tax=Pseudomonas sp. TH49 TaxID=2796413 RepID=UPI00191380DC|nr:hypothetical protein [Pseudomonas sp. TH49]MBK5343850.1 hypothetical protein [Pseudomonas sp. TH49]
MDVYKSLIPVIGPVLAAMIAGTIAFIVAVLTKENKTSEFRQAWIEALRNDVAELIGHLHAIIDFAEDSDDTKNIILEKHNEFIKMEISAARIKLRLNPAEHQDIIKTLNSLHDKGDDTLKDMVANLDKLLGQIQFLLKGEWVRVKQGEPSFRWLKRISLGLVLLAITIGIALVLYKTSAQ